MKRLGDSLVSVSKLSSSFRVRDEKAEGLVAAVNGFQLQVLGSEKHRYQQGLIVGISE